MTERVGDVIYGADMELLRIVEVTRICSPRVEIVAGPRGVPVVLDIGKVRYTALRCEPVNNPTRRT